MKRADEQLLQSANSPGAQRPSVGRAVGPRVGTEEGGRVAGVMLTQVTTTSLPTSVVTFVWKVVLLSDACALALNAKTSALPVAEVVVTMSHEASQVTSERRRRRRKKLYDNNQP